MNNAILEFFGAYVEHLLYVTHRFGCSSLSLFGLPPQELPLHKTFVAFHLYSGNILLRQKKNYPFDLKTEMFLLKKLTLI